MAKQNILIGTSPNDGTGDALRTAFTKTNSNFTELYNAVEEVRYTLPTASGSTLGGVKIGNNITMFNGVISVASQVQPDWSATTGLGKILNKPADNTIFNEAYVVALQQDGTLNLPNFKQITSNNPNTNNGLGAIGRVGWFNHPNPDYADGANVRVWGLYTEGDIVLRTSNGTDSSPYWQFNKLGHIVLPENGGIAKSDGSSYLDYNNLINIPANLNVLTSTVPTTQQGAPGDKKGDVKYSNDYVYICINDYDGVQDIWKRINCSSAW